MSAPGHEGKVAGAKVAHAIRRTGALYIAAITLPEGTDEHTLFVTAERYARWIRGEADDADVDDEFDPTDTYQP